MHRIASLPSSSSLLWGPSTHSSFDALLIARNQFSSFSVLLVHLLVRLSFCSANRRGFFFSFWTSRPGQYHHRPFYFTDRIVRTLWNADDNSGCKSRIGSLTIIGSDPAFAPLRKVSPLFPVSLLRLFPNQNPHLIGPPPIITNIRTVLGVSKVHPRSSSLSSRFDCLLHRHSPNRTCQGSRTQVPRSWCCIAAAALWARANLFDPGTQCTSLPRPGQGCWLLVTASSSTT